MRKMVGFAFGSLLCGALGAGCGYEGALMPVGSMDGVPELRPAVYKDVDGIRLIIEGDRWPSDVVPLARGVAAVRVTVDNHSGAAVLVRHDEFALEGQAGYRFAALPPNAVPVPNSDQPTMIVQPIFGPGGAAWHDNLRPLPMGPHPAPELSRWETSFPYDQFYYKGVTLSPAERRGQPQASALPEGVLPNGRRAAGFVYFVTAGDAGADHGLVFEARLAKAPSANGAAVSVASASIPMRFR
jgi:hypothetical protein